MLTRLIVSAALCSAAGACAPSSEEQGDPQGRSAPIKTAKADKIMPCPETSLSCGQQQPIISDGARPFINEEMGIRAIFPRGDRICLSRSGDAARGFYADYREVGRACSEDQQQGRTMGISSSFNAAEYSSVRQFVTDCRPLSQNVRGYLKGGQLQFPDRSTLVCQENRNGAVVIIAHTLTQDGAGETPVPSVHYWATLRSTQDSVAKDVPMFEQFLASLKIQETDAHR